MVLDEDNVKKKAIWESDRAHLNLMSGYHPIQHRQHLCFL